MKIYKHLTANAINLTSFDFTRELSMEAYLIENPLVLTLDNEGFDEVEIIEDELSITSGRESKDTDGRIDLVGYYNSSNTLGIIELKKGSIGTENIDQLTDYLKERAQILESIKSKNPEIEDPDWIGILAGTNISSELISFIQDGKTLEIGKENIPLAALTIKRYKSDDGQFFIATETYQNIAKTSKDFKKYTFNGNTYGKGRLVLAVIQDFAQNNPNITYAQLKNKFPDKLQGSSGVFVSKKDADAKNSLGKTRYFAKPNELIQLSDEVIAVSNQWGSGNIDKLIEKAKENNLLIEEAT